MKKYIVLDTNILASYFETGFTIYDKGGESRISEELKNLDQLLKILKENKAELILPEVVYLESQRIKAEKESELKDIYDQALKSVEKTNSGNKQIAEKSIEKIQSTMTNLCQKEIKKNNEAWKKFKQIFKNKNTHTVELTGKILLASYKRRLMGKKPHSMRYSIDKKPIHDIQPDCIIIESIKDFLAQKSKSSYQLILCTDDVDFYASEKKDKIDKNIMKELNIVKNFCTLGDMLEKLFNLKVVKKTKKVSKEIEAFPITEEETTESEGSVESQKIAVSKI